MASTKQVLSVTEILQAAEQIAKDPKRFKGYADKPVEFQKEILGWTPWKKQADVMKAVAKGRRVSVKSGHGTGKTRTAAGIALWWLYARQGVVVTTAPTKEHVEDVLWREINMLFAGAKVSLPGEISGTALKITNAWNATGITTNKPGAFQGRHDPNLLVIIDEAAGVEEPIHLEAGMLATGEKNCILMIGNPTTTSGTFYDSFNRSTIWARIHISCAEHPNVTSGQEIIPGAVTRTWVEEQKQKWGENHPLWYSRVLGEFPKISNRGVIPLGWVDRAHNPEKLQAALIEATTAQIPRVGGLDVARYGENVCVLCVRRGDAIEHIEHWSHLSLMETAKKALEAIEKWQLQGLVVDGAGIGGGVVDRLLEQGAPVFDFNGGHRAFTPGTFSNRRAELWWALRQRFEKERIWLPHYWLEVDYDPMVSDLIAPEYEIATSGRIKIESKEQMLKDGKKSPDFGDALTMCFALDLDPLELSPQLPDPKRDQTPIFESYDDPFPTLPSGF